MSPYRESDGHSYRSCCPSGGQDTHWLWPCCLAEEPHFRLWGGCQVVLWAADCHSLALGSSREAPSCAFHGSWTKDTGFMTSRAMVTWKPGCWSGRNWPSSARFSPSGVNHCLPFSFYLGQIMRCVFTGQHASGLCDFQLN